MCFGDNPLINQHDAICVMEIMWETHADTFLSALMNISILLLGNIYGRHIHNQTINDQREQFTILKKCRGKLDCVIYEMLFIKDKKRKLNVTLHFQSHATKLSHVFHYITNPQMMTWSHCIETSFNIAIACFYFKTAVFNTSSYRQLIHYLEINMKLSTFERTQANFTVNLLYKQL